MDNYVIMKRIPNTNSDTGMCYGCMFGVREWCGAVNATLLCKDGEIWVPVTQEEYQVEMEITILNRLIGTIKDWFNWKGDAL